MNKHTKNNTLQNAIKWRGMLLVPAVEVKEGQNMDEPMPPLYINGKKAYALPGGGFICQ